MKTIRKKNVFIVLSLLLIVMLFFSAFFLVFNWMPAKAELLFGPPDDRLDRYALGLLSTRLVWNRRQLLDGGGESGSIIPFVIVSGETGRDVADHLADEGLIKDANLLVDYWTYTGEDRLIQTGAYLLETDASAVGIANKLVNQSPDLITVSFLSGWRKEEVINLLQQTNLAGGVFAIEQWEGSGFPACQPDGFGNIRNAEGFLFGGEYVLPRKNDINEMLCAFVDGFDENLPVDFHQRANDAGLNGYEAVILASIIEKEAILDDEAARISGVFHNRLQLDMPLQSDPTVQYALGWQAADMTWWKNPLASSDLQVNSPYNTYATEGLPPGPICSPGSAALKASVTPEKHDYLFFRAACDGSGKHVFSRTYEEHLAAACD